MKRVMIYGGSGSGKSTLAQKLGAITGLPVVHIDPMYWKPGWVQREKSETSAMILAATAKDAWIFEGNHHSTFPERIARADHMIYLDFPAYLRMWQAFTRMLKYRGKSRPDMAADCPERFTWEFNVLWVGGHYWRSHKRDLEIITTGPDHVTCYHLKSRRAVRQFLTDVEAEYDQT